jgi:hypothetical protein
MSHPPSLLTPDNIDNGAGGSQATWTGGPGSRPGRSAVGEQGGESINDDGSLSNRSNFALLNLLTKNKVESWWLGPDSMKIDSKGNIYVAQWFGGKILKLSPEGKLLHVFEIAAGDGTTNVAFSEGEKELYVTVVKDPNDSQAKGSIVKIANVK